MVSLLLLLHWQSRSTSVVLEQYILTYNYIFLSHIFFLIVIMLFICLITARLL